MIERPFFSERHAVTTATFALAVGMLLMAREDPTLWDVELFKTLLTAIVITGILNMVLSFHYAANKGDEDKTANTGAAFRAIEATATGVPPEQPKEGPQEVKVVNTKEDAVHVEETKP